MSSTPVAEPAATSPSAAPEKLDKDVLLVAGVVVLSAIMSILDVTVVSVALPTFMAEFSASYAQVAWTMTGYTLALATVIPLTGWAADRFGTKRLFMAAIALFVAGSLLCATASSIETLVAYRVLQGLGGGMLMPLGMTIMTRAAGPQRIGRVMAVLGVPMLLGPIFGPILGGWLIDSATWHWIFLINLPIGIIALVYAALILPKDHTEPSESFDFVGMLLLSPGLALFLYGVSSIPETGTVAATKVLVPGLIGLGLIVLFVLRSLFTSVAHPLIDLHLFKNRQLTISVITMTLFAVAFFGAGILFPSYFLQIRGETTLKAGVLLAPQGLGAMLSMPIAGMLADKIGAGKIVLFGTAVITASMAVFTQVSPTTSYELLLGALFVMGIGLGATMMPTMTAALQTLTDHNIARGSTLMNVIQQVAGSIGTAVMSVVLTNAYLARPSAAQVAAASEAGGPAAVQQLPPETIAAGLVELAESFGVAFTVATVLVGLCLIPAFFLPRTPPERPHDPEGQAEHTPLIVH
ncbi:MULTISPECIES: DHA2 family efflux MFS transporter permease subunit [unclassified Janibacter]|uniref:DHA2 family efflux MFS transporter permease subunit n=1 Tax=unclassified Janibacter TaxID=2649294 RepID=UPI003D08E81A